MYLFAIIVIFMIGIFGIIFGAQNTAVVTVKLFSASYSIPLISVIIVSFCAGAVLAFILAIIDEIRLRGKISKQQKEMEHLKKELGTLKITSVGEEEDTDLSER
ncbi:MAG: LapA family protein [bacterium]|nr:LapA family protein [bacterium]